MMKRTLLTLYLAASCFAALPVNTTTWEVRTLGNANNGSCFVTGASGTDFSQQNAAQFSGTDLVLATGSTATSVSHSFVATDVGNCIQITAGTGFTPGFYEIISVSLGVATFDRSAGTAASTGGTWAEGGAVTSPNPPLAAASAGNTIWVKADGTYTFTASVVFNTDNTVNGGSTKVVGYSASRGDGLRAAWTTATNSIALIGLGTTSNARGIEFDNLTLTDTAGTPGDGLASCSRNSVNVSLNNVSFSGFNIGIHADDNTCAAELQNLALLNVEVKSSVSHGMRLSWTPDCTACFIHNNGGDGVQLVNLAGSTSHWVDSIFDSNTGNGITFPDNQTNQGRGLSAVNCVFSRNVDGVRLTSANQAGPFTSVNSIYYSNSGFGINSTSLQAWGYFQNNAFGANTSGATQNLPVLHGTVTLTANPFTSIGTNFALNSTAGGGALLKAAGFPGVTIASGTGFVDIGALQSQAAAAAGTFTVGIP